MSSGQTVVRYGDVQIFRCTTRIEQSAVMEQSGTDMKCWKFTVHVSGYLHGHEDWCQRHAPAIAGGDAARNHAAVRYQLAPRQVFRLRTGVTDQTDEDSGTILIQAYPASAGITNPRSLQSTSPLPYVTGSGPQGLSDYDVDDGPRCLQFNVDQIVGNDVFSVEAIFEIHKVECDQYGEAHDNLNGVLSHRWSCVDDLDVNLQLTRSYYGLLELATSKFSPHWFRSLCVPPLEGGMRRDSMRFSASEDGKKLQYVIQDREISVSAPNPAKKWHVTHTEGAHFSQLGYGSVEVSLEGSTDASVSDLVTVALEIIKAKITKRFDGTFVESEKYYCEDISFTHHIGDVTAVTARATVRRACVTVGNFAAFAANMVGVPIDVSDLAGSGLNDSYDSKRSFGSSQPVYRGPVPLVAIFGCYLQSSCNGYHSLNETFANGSINVLAYDYNSDVKAIPKTSISAAIVNDISVDNIPYSDSHREAIYRVYEVESYYDKRMLRAAMPLSYIIPSSGGTKTAEVVNLGAPQVIRVVRVVSERIGRRPQMPDDNAFDRIGNTQFPGYRFKLLRSRRLGGTRKRLATGQYLYRSRFEAKFAVYTVPFDAGYVSLNGSPIGRNRVYNDPLPESSDGLDSGANQGNDQY